MISSHLLGAHLEALLCCRAQLGDGVGRHQRWRWPIAVDFARRCRCRRCRRCRGTSSNVVGERQETGVEQRREIERVAQGDYDATTSPLRYAPHTAETVTVEDWDRGYTRQEAVFPVPAVVADKYWPPVSRIDQAYGDRNLVCSCPPVEQFADES